ncbi:Cell division protein ZapA [Roseovarius albus]|uniref:Cell division protein ZapA n=1 Tax=Roseovarius albus TaxID=1247867 RepID=A0A1X6ZCH9_9RHOB|nr:cell division protein ZapA [Roseovarius albus]SLN47140.1 Cell division protein ZapA [Roseovarius albus]
MPEIKVEIGGRNFEVACQEGEEHFLHSAAKMLDDEASVLASQIGRIPESRMLLMAGLMLADKTAGFQDKLREAEERVTELQAQLNQLKAAPAAEAERIEVEVPVMPEGLTEAMAELAAQSEALAEAVEARAASEG